MAQPVTQIDRAIGATIKQLREGAGMSQPRVAEVLGVSYQSFQKIEGGKVSFRASTLVKLASLFGVPLTRLLEDADLPSLVENGEEAVHLNAMIKEMSPEDANAVVAFASRLKHGVAS